MNRSQIRLLLPLEATIVLSLPGDQTLYAVLPIRSNWSESAWESWGYC